MARPGTTTWSLRDHRLIYRVGAVEHLPLVRYYAPDEFAEIKAFAQGLGYGRVESGPLVRSSYHAEEQVPGR